MHDVVFAIHLCQESCAEGAAQLTQSVIPACNMILPPLRRPLFSQRPSPACAHAKHGRRTTSVLICAAHKARGWEHTARRRSAWRQRAERIRTHCARAAGKLRPVPATASRHQSQRGAARRQVRGRCCAGPAPAVHMRCASATSRGSGRGCRWPLAAVSQADRQAHWWHIASRRINAETSVDTQRHNIAANSSAQ